MNFGLTTENIKEIVNSGYCYEVLHNKIITIATLLKYLRNNVCNEESLLAYRCVCIFANPVDHYIDGRHFTSIMESIEYLLIFLLSGGNEKTPIYQGKNVWLVHERASELAKIYKTKSRFTRIRVLCDLESSERFKHLQLVVHSKKCQSNHRDLADYFNTHRYDLIKNVILDSDYRILIREAQRQCDQYKWLWDTYIKDIYEELVNHLYNQGLPESITKRDVEDLSELFPGLIPEDVLSLSYIAFEIYRHKDIILKAYLLGYPIQYFIPDEKKILISLRELTSLGIDEYCKKMKKKQPCNLKLNNFDSSLSYNNMEDVMYEDVNNYPPFDVITYVEGDQIYRFTRPEYNSILTDKMNVWRNTQLPDIIIMEIEKRQAISIKHKFPKSEKWEDMLNVARIISDDNLMSPRRISSSPINSLSSSISDSSTNIFGLSSSLLK